MPYVMAVEISGTRNGAEWPALGQPVPADLPADEVAALRLGGLIREVAPQAEPAPVVEVSRPVAPEVRARARRTRGATE